MTRPDTRPKQFPPPEFPPRKLPPFARTPPAIFPPILGLLALTGALRLALDLGNLPLALGDLLAGAALGLWAFAVFAYGAKLVRRPAVVVEDLRVLPGRSGLAAMTMGGMAAAALVADFSLLVAKGLLVLSLAGHLVLAVLVIRLLLTLPPPGRAVNPTWHLSFVGFILAGPAAIAVGWPGLAEALLWAIIPVASLIWVLSAVQFAQSIPPAPLRPLLAIHIAPAAVLSTVASLLGQPELALAFALLAGTLAGFILVPLRWTLGIGPSPMWGALTFPLAALAKAYLLLPGGLWVGTSVLLIAVLAIPAILVWVLRHWLDGRLAAMTNAAEA